MSRESCRVFVGRRRVVTEVARNTHRRRSRTGARRQIFISPSLISFQKRIVSCFLSDQLIRKKPTLLSLRSYGMGDIDKTWGKIAAFIIA